MELLVTPNEQTADQLIGIRMLKKRAVAIATQIHKLHFHSSSRINLCRSSYCRTATQNVKGYVFQFAITMDYSPLPDYSFYYFHDIDNDGSFLFVGTYGKHGAINFQKVGGTSIMHDIKTELKHADFIKHYDVKFVFTHSFNALHEAVKN